MLMGGNMRTEFRFMIALALGCFGQQFVSLGANAQIAIPVAGTLEPPPGFSFAGNWSCQDGPRLARLRVEPRLRFDKNGVASPRTWTRLHESEAWFSGDYLIGFDQDHSRLLMIDAKDPAIQRFHTDGWKGNRLILESTFDQERPFEPFRIEYEVVGPHAFTVTWETQTDAGWKTDPAVNCLRTEAR
jgi:hypothetical protein